MHPGRAGALVSQDQHRLDATKQAALEPGGKVAFVDAEDVIGRLDHDG